MINNELFLGVLFCVFILISPLVALLERLFLALGILLTAFCLGIVLLSTPILFLSGVFLIIASEATVTNGLYYILFSIISPFILIPLLLFLYNLVDDDLLFESAYTIPLANILIVLLALIIIGTSSIYFTAVVILSFVLMAGDFTMTKIIKSG